MIERSLRARSFSTIWCAVLLMGAAVLGIGCRPTTPTLVDVELAAAWPSALVATERAHLDLGNPETRPHLGSGWYYDEQNRQTGDTFVWSRGRSSEVFFHLGWRREISMELGCSPFQYPDASTQTVVLELNDTVIGELELDPSRARTGVGLPAEAQVVGRNRLLLRYGRVDAPADVTPGSTDDRELAVACSALVFDPMSAAPVVIADATVGMPTGTQADFFLELAPRSRLRIDACESLESGNRLELTLLGESDDRIEASDHLCDGSPIDADLGNRSGLTRVRLTATPADGGGEPTVLRLRHPRILKPAPVALADDHQATRDQLRKPLPTRPNVVIYLVDALRSDRLGVYGGERSLSPRLDAMAVDSVTFTDVVAQSSWTKAAVASIFTGFWPGSHGVNGPDDRLPDDLRVLPELLQGAGYETAAVVANAYVGRPFGFARGFDSFEFIEHPRGRSEVIHDRVVAWLDSRTPGADPFFLYVHTIDPHEPYAPPQPYLGRFASRVEDPTVGQVETVRGLVLGTVEPTPELGRDLRDLYDAEVAANDASFGRLLNELEARGELENTIVIFTSDHGEAFGEHGSWTHGLDLYNEVLSIPLVVRLPGGAGAGQRVPTTVQHIDLLPTILDLCSLEPVTALPGEILLDGSGAVRVGGDRTVFSYLDYWDRNGAAAYRDGWKLIEPLSANFGAETQLFHHVEDRAELRDLRTQNAVRSGWLEAQLAVVLRDRASGLPTAVDAETREQLEALGYMQ